jgi:hypothetical protein
MRSSRVGIPDTAGKAADIVGSGARGVRSTDRIVANTVNTAATANTADTEHPNMDRSRGHRPVPEGRGCPRQANPKVQVLRKTLSSNYPPFRV